VILGMFIVNSLINTGNTIYTTREISKKIPIGPFVQVLKIFLYFITLILLVSMLVNKSPLFLISGLGAIAAVLLLVFKDTLMGFVAGIQLIANRMISKGDWISMPAYGADGDVKEITLATVKVENWDKTITTIPTYALVSESFKNWKNMSGSGGRRIKRSIHIDMSGIKFCNNEMLERFSEIHRLKKFLNSRIRDIEEYNRTIIKNHSSVVDLRNLTNIGVLRYYILHYLKEHPKIHKDSDKWTFMVRQLSPGENGLPLEVYVFSNDVNWVKYEELMSDIFDHILAVIPLFDLRVFQNPTGSDFRHWLPAPDTSSTVPMP
jgi:miniconductance mechanosensitive channel